jgi:hypothetical protein
MEGSRKQKNALLAHVTLKQNKMEQMRNQEKIGRSFEPPDGGCEIDVFHA